MFYKVEATENIIHKYNIDELPSLLIFKKENLLGHVDGYYTSDSKEEMINKIKISNIIMLNLFLKCLYEFLPSKNPNDIKSRGIDTLRCNAMEMKSRLSIIK